MISKVYSAIPQGYDGHIVEVEGDANRGLPAFNIVGMANKTITEARERVRSALVNSGFDFPQRKVTISLAPAELAKDGSHLDLPIALAILVLSEQLLPQNLDGRLFVGELALDGLIRPVRGIINLVEAAKQAGYREIYLPKASLDEAKLITGIKIFGVTNLLELFLHLKGQVQLHPATCCKVVNITQTNSKPPYPCLDDIKGQSFAKRALSIAIAGHHNLLLTGPPGTGKSLLAQAASNLLPPPTPLEQIEIAKVHSLSGTLIQTCTRPFRSPHHTSSPIAIIGGGHPILPGEVSLAYHGILFLDELPEYHRYTLEALCQPLEDGFITISRAKQRARYPANFILIATMNPCPCGYFGDPYHPCTCSLTQIQNYQKRISGPIYDRIDMAVSVNRLTPKELFYSLPNVVENNKTEEKSLSEHNAVKNNITEAVQRQNRRYGHTNFYNASVNSTKVQQYIKLHPAAKTLLHQATEQFGLSTRSYFKIIKVAQTIADLSSETEVRPEHISEALSFRGEKFEH